MKKRVISILLAAIMVVLLLPLAAVSVSATDPYHAKWDFTTLDPNDGTSGNVNSSMPTGWVATKDTESTFYTAVNYDRIAGSDVQVNNGIRLGGAGQGIGMTSAAGIPDAIKNATTNYYIQVKWNTMYKFAQIRWGWADVAYTSESTSVAASQQIRYPYLGGPNNGSALGAEGGHYDNLYMTTGGWCSDIRNLENVKLTEAEAVALHQAAAIEGRQATTTLVVADGKLNSVYITLGGNTVKYNPAGDFTAVTGYFSCWIEGWAAGNTATIQSVEIQEGTFDPATLPTATGTSAVTTSGTIGSTTPYVYSTDFTNLTSNGGTRGTIVDSLPAGWIANFDKNGVTANETRGTITTAVNYEMNHSEWTDDQADNGVRLGGAGQGIMMTSASGLPTEITNATVDYTLTVKWNTTHKFKFIAFGWSAAAQKANATSFSGTNVRYYYAGGLSEGQVFVDGGNANCGKFTFDAESTYSSGIYDENGNILTDRDAIAAIHEAGAVAGNQVTTTFEIVGGKLIAVYNTIDSKTIKYVPESDYTAVTGYFTCQILGWGDNNAASIQSVEIREGSLATFKGVQNTEADGENRQKIRLVATVGSSDFDYLGFNVSYQVGDGDTTVRNPQYCQYVYTSIQGDGNTYTASNLGGRYIYALSMEGVPTNAGTVTFTVSTFAKKGDVTYRGPSYVVVYENGAFVSGTQVSADA